MRKSILHSTLPLLFLLAFVQGARAQEDGLPDFKMSCRQVLRLTPTKFADVYGKRTEDYSTFGQKQAFRYYVSCKRPANDALAVKLLSEERRKQADATREEINKFGGTLWDLTYAEAGGGTMWGLIAASAYAERESFMETLIRALAAEKRSPRARRRVEAHLARIQRMLGARERKPFTEGSEPEDAAQTKKLYGETIQEARDSLARLRAILGSLPDAAAERVAVAMASETANALQYQQ